MKRHAVLLIMTVVSLTVRQPTLAAVPARFAGALADGSRIAGDQLTDWHGTDTQPKLDGRPLLSPANPMYWLVDHELKPAKPPTAFVEMISGDCLPGRVVEYRHGTESSYEPLPPHLIVETEIPLNEPGKPLHSEVRVLTRFVRRLVWERRPRGRYCPATLFFRHGGEVVFRSVRFRERHVLLMSEAGLRQVPFAEIAELHLPASDPWEAYYDELAIVGMGERTRVVHWETTTGLVLTGSLSRFQAAGQDKPADCNAWHHALQPSWALESLWVPASTIRVRRMFAPHEVPLTRLLPTESRRQRLLGGARQWQCNRNHQERALRSGGQEFACGLAVHAPSELRFPLPRTVKSFRTTIGLDQIAGSGGCVRARIFTGSTDGRPLYESPLLIGSQKTIDTGCLALAGKTAAPGDLILQVDAVPVQIPAGADPLDIRDMFDWLDPQLKLDPARLRAEVSKRIPALIPAWDGWAAVIGNGSSLCLGNRWDAWGPGPTHFRAGVAVREKPLTLTRRWRVGPQQNWLVVAVTEGGQSTNPPQITVRVNGTPFKQQAVPVRTEDNLLPPPLAFPLSRFRGQNVDVEISQSADNLGLVHWQAIVVSDRIPTRRQFFEDDDVFVAQEEGEANSVILHNADKYSAGRCLKITPSQRVRLSPPGDPARIREYPRLGEFRYVRFASRKFGGGRICVELEHALSKAKPARYDAGHGDPCYGAAIRVWELTLPNKWIVITRDLYADFGEIDVTGMTLSVPDGQHALLDHVYLARTQQDFVRFPDGPTPERTNHLAMERLVQPACNRGLAATVVIEAGGRTGTGVIVSADGDMLTAGHFLAGAGEDLTLHLADGRKVKGKALGIYRDRDCGLAKITEPGPWPFVEMAEKGELSSTRLHVAISYDSSARKVQDPTVYFLYAAGNARNFPGTIWTVQGSPNFASGSPLLEQSGRLVGFYSALNRYGGYVYTLIGPPREHWERLKKGDVWGQWPEEATPTLGLSLAAANGGGTVTAVVPDTPAAGAGLRPGDLVMKMDGQPLGILKYLPRRLLDKDPGEEVTLEIHRGKQVLHKKIALAPRRP